jgi:hypothetical protein
LKELGKKTLKDLILRNTLINTNEFQEQIKDLRIVDLAVIDLDQAIIGDEF